VEDYVVELGENTNEF
jgi:hypothetical protein